MLREYRMYPWHFGGPAEFYPSETNAVIADAKAVRDHEKAARSASSKRRSRGARRG